MSAFGDRALLIARPAGSADEVASALATVRGVVDHAWGEEQLAVYFDGAPTIDELELARLLSCCIARTLPRHTVDLLVRYNGADLAEVGAACGLSRDEVVRVHSSVTYEVSFLGFVPGFAYLKGLDARLVLPRRSVPRERVPRNSLAIGGPYTGVYPLETPGGWHLLGELVEPQLFDKERGPLLRTEDRVRFVEIA